MADIEQLIIEIHDMIKGNRNILISILNRLTDENIQPIIKGIKKRKDVPKRAADGKIPDDYKISKKPCTRCNGLIAWPPYIPDKDLKEGERRRPPIHCDENGNIIGDGLCPEWTPE